MAQSEQPLPNGADADHALSARKRRALGRIASPVPPTPDPEGAAPAENSVPEPHRPGRWTSAHTRRLHRTAAGRGGRLLVVWLPLLTLVAALEGCARLLRRVVGSRRDD